MIMPILIEKKSNKNLNFSLLPTLQVNGAVLDMDYYHSPDVSHSLVVGVNSHVKIISLENLIYNENYELTNEHILATIGT
jgi:CPSF A subunit region